MEFEGRLLVDDFVAREFDHEVDEVVRGIFTRKMAASPSTSGMLGFEAPGRVVADRLDALGHTADRALDALDESLDLTRCAYESLHEDSDPTMIVSDPLTGLLTLDAEGWLRLFSESRRTPRQLHSQWLMALLQDRGAGEVLRLVALARPDAILRLEVQPDIAWEQADLPRQLVITQTAADAEALRFAIQGRTPHLTDLLLVSHLGGHESPADLCAQVAGMMRLRLLQPLTAVFRPDGAMDSMMLNERPDSVRVLVAPNVPLLDPPATLTALLELIGVGIGPRLPRRRPWAPGGAAISPTGVKPSSD